MTINMAGSTTSARHGTIRGTSIAAIIWGNLTTLLGKLVVGHVGGISNTKAWVIELLTLLVNTVSHVVIHGDKSEQNNA